MHHASKEPVAPARQSAVYLPQRNRLWQLEALRGFAAFYVLLHHISSSYLGLKHTVWGFPFRFGQEGVLVFFLLSGFVIYYSHGPQRAAGNDFVTYLVKRGRRIYPIFGLSLLLAYGIQCLSAGSLLPVNLGSLAGNLFMLQTHPDTPGNLFLPFADNMPLWSLSYEWWFYMMFFPINRWVCERWQKYVVFGLCGLGLTINFFWSNPAGWFLVLFPIWWVGVELAREFLTTGQITLSRQKAMLALLAVPLLWFGWLTWQWRQAGNPVFLISYPLVDFRYFFMAIIFLLLTLLWKNWGFVGFNRTLGWFGWLGTISYALYLFHYPVICDLRLLPGGTGFYFDLCLRILLAFALAWLAEVKLQKWINARTDCWLKSRRR